MFLPFIDAFPAGRLADKLPFHHPGADSGNILCLALVTFNESQGPRGTG